MPALNVTAWTATCSAGVGRLALLESLRARRTGLRRNDFGDERRLDTWIGRVDAVEEATLPSMLGEWECRNNRLAWLGLNQDAFADAVVDAARRHGAGRVAIVIGTSTSSIGATEEAYARLGDGGGFPDDLARACVHTPHSLGGFVQQALSLEGPCVTVATACSSSAKVFAQAARLIGAGIVDAAVVGGVDTLCGSVLFGFNSLQLVSNVPCQPFDVHRRGLSLGEAAGFALLERDGTGPKLVGYGESSDAHHMSSPHPQGLGARMAMGAALESAGLDASAIDYINLHGTATPLNDEVESLVVASMFPPGTFASSTKGWTGHTLGAAGILESAICLLALDSGFVPGTLNTRELDGRCGPQVRIDNEQRDCRFAMNNSFGFGGSNCSLVFAREGARA